MPCPAWFRRSAAWFAIAAARCTIVVAAVTYVVATALLVLVVAPHVPSGNLALGSLGGVFGVFVVSSVAPAFLTAMLVRQSRRVWGVARIAATYLPLFLLVAALQLGGAAAEAWWPVN